MSEKLPSQLTLGFIPAATREPIVTVKPTDSLLRARTLMELHDYSQLPVVADSRLRNPSGVVSWESIGRRVLSGAEPTLAACIDTSVQKLPLSQPLPAAIKHINQDGSVLVVDDTNALTGIVTVADLGEELANLATPFLDLERCEELLRAAVHHVVAVHGVDLSRVANATKRAHDQTVEPADLTMGALLTVLERPGVLADEIAGFDTKTLRSRLAQVVEARNEVMHFRERSEATRRTLADLANINAVLEQVAVALRATA